MVVLHLLDDSKATDSERRIEGDLESIVQLLRFGKIVEGCVLASGCPSATLRGKFFDSGRHQRTFQTSGDEMPPIPSEFVARRLPPAIVRGARSPSAMWA